MSPFSHGERRPASGSEPLLASAAAGRGMVRTKVGKLISSLDSDVCSWAAETHRAAVLRGFVGA